MKALLAVAAAALMTATAHADCAYPSPPGKLPDGNSATMEEMVSAQKDVKEYNKQIETYLGCLDKEQKDAIASAGDKPSDEQKAKLQKIQQLQTQKHNAAVDQMQSVADRFNEQVRIFKSRDKK